VSSQAAPIDPRALARRIALPRVDAGAAATVSLGAILAAVALEGTGGLQLGPLTTVEIGLEVLAGVAGVAALLAAPTRRLYGGVALALFGLLLLFTAASVIWAVDPDDAWVEANRTLAWFAAFALGVALARVTPNRWEALLGGEDPDRVPVAERLSQPGVDLVRVQRAGEDLREHGAPRVLLWTAEQNPAAQRLFSDLGFRRTMIEMTREL